MVFCFFSSDLSTSYPMNVALYSQKTAGAYDCFDLLGFGGG